MTTSDLLVQVNGVDCESGDRVVLQLVCDEGMYQLIGGDLKIRCDCDLSAATREHEGLRLGIVDYYKGLLIELLVDESSVEEGEALVAIIDDLRKRGIIKQREDDHQETPNDLMAKTEAKGALLQLEQLLDSAAFDTLLFNDEFMSEAKELLGTDDTEYIAQVLNSDVFNSLKYQVGRILRNRSASNFLVNIGIYPPYLSQDFTKVLINALRNQ